MYRRTKKHNGTEKAPHVYFPTTNRKGHIVDYLVITLITIGIRHAYYIFYHMLSYLEVLLRTDCECIEATVMKRILHYAGRVARMHDDRLPNIVMRGEMVGGKR